MSDKKFSKIEPLFSKINKTVASFELLDRVGLPEGIYGNNYIVSDEVGMRKIFIKLEILDKDKGERE